MGCRKILRDVKRRIEAEGFQLVSIGMTGTSHYRLTVADRAGREAIVVMSGTPGVLDKHAIQETIQKIRRQYRGA